MDDLGEELQRMMRESLRYSLDSGLCADKTDHASHVHASKTLGTFWCTAIQSDREPWRSEQRRKVDAG